MPHPYRDTNTNGVINTGEFVTSMATDSNGKYLFTGLVPGDYIVAIPASNFASGGALEHLASSTGGGSEPAVSPENNVVNDDNGTAQPDGSVVSQPLTLSSNGEPTNDGDADANTNLTVNFGFYPLATLGDLVWIDSNKNGIYDAGEQGSNGVSIDLYAAGADGLAGTGDDVFIATTVPDTLGAYEFIDLVPGQYYVVFQPNTGFLLTQQDAGIDNTADSDAAPTTGQTEVLTLGPGQNDPTWDAGLFYTASIGDYVWLDANADGIQDSTELGTPNVTITLYTSAGVQVGNPAVTAADGSYAFANVAPGDYYLVFTADPSYIGSPAAQGGNTASDSNPDPANGQTPVFTVALNSANPTLDAGFYQLVSLGNVVWNDVDNDGLFDTGESAISGVVMNLYRDANGNGQIDAGEFVATDTTSGVGTYLFDNLVPGSYIVQIDPANFATGNVLQGYTSSTGAVGTNTAPGGPYEPAPTANNDTDNDDNGSLITNQGIVSAAVTLTSGGEPTTDGDANANSNLTIDFGVFQPASIGSFVWNDTNKDGIYNNGELGIPGVTVTLYNAAGQPVATVTTGPDGSYLLVNVPAGVYTLGFSNLPADTTFAPINQGGNDNNDSDVNPATGQTASITLAPGQVITNVFAGLIPVQPTAITLIQFGAAWEGKQVAVTWQTSQELNTLGYNIYRSTDTNRAHAVRVNTTLLPSKGVGQAGASYRWVDTNVTAGTQYSYWLEEREIGGKSHEFGPVTTRVQPTASSIKVFLPVIAR